MDRNHTYELAEQYYEQGEYKKACDLFVGLSRENKSNDLLNYIGCCYLKLGLYTQAKGVFEKLIKQNPTWERPLFHLGRVYLKLGNRTQALVCFNMHLY